MRYSSQSEKRYSRPQPHFFNFERPTQSLFPGKAWLLLFQFNSWDTLEMATAERCRIFKIHGLLTWGLIWAVFSRGVTVGVWLSSVKRSVSCDARHGNHPWWMGTGFHLQRILVSLESSHMAFCSTVCDQQFIASLWNAGGENLN